MKYCRLWSYEITTFLFYQGGRIEVDGSSSTSEGCVVPVLSDYIVIYSTLHNCVSFRSPEHGSVFIYHLCENLKKGADRGLLSILMSVRLEMLRWYFDDNGTICTQISEDNSTLIDDVYFQTNAHRQ